jgi:choline dehydrogenase
MAICLSNACWVPNGLYDRAVKALGHVGITDVITLMVADVITLMGYYTSVSMTLAFTTCRRERPASHAEYRARHRRECNRLQTYDYIVVGAGSAGAVVANRLSADPRRVLLLEAGRASHPWSRIPIGYARLIANPAANWLYSAEPEASTNGRRIRVPRGKLLGGSSSINGQVFVRGQAQDFDSWAQLGNWGWSYEDVLPFFRRMESYAGAGDDKFRGREGPLRVTNPEPREAIFATLIEAAGEVGIPHNPDYNGAWQDGIAMSQATIASGRRMSTARCYLDPITTGKTCISKPEH